MENVMMKTMKTRKMMMKKVMTVITMMMNSTSSLSILTLTHMEEEVEEEVDFSVDLVQPPEPTLLQFLYSNLSRQMQVCLGLEEERLLTSGIECSKVLIERLGGSIHVRSRSCLQIINSAADSNLTDGETNLTCGNRNNSRFVCCECQLLIGAAGGSEVKRELIESCPDFPGDLDQEWLDEKEDLAKEEIKKILPKMMDRKKTRRKPAKRKKEEDEDVDDKGDNDKDWGDAGRKRSSQKFLCPDSDCETSFTKEVKVTNV